MKKFLKWLTGSYSNEYFHTHKDVIQKHNSKILGITLIITIVYLITFIIIEVATHILNIDIWFYLGMTIIVSAMYVIHKLFTHDKYLPTIIMISVFIWLFNIFLIIAETYGMSDKNAVIYYVFMIAVPITVIMPTCAVEAFYLVSYVVFMVMSYSFKENNLFVLDSLYGLCCFTAGMFLGRYILKNTFDWYDLNDKLKYQSRYDPLTNIYNRRAGSKRIEEVLENEKRIAVAMVDIDDFKLYNDTYGHVKGDEILRTIASIFLYHVKKRGYFVVRYGGEEFLVCTYGDGASEMEEILHECAKDLSLARIVDKNSKFGRVTFSAGFTICDECKDIETLINRADIGLYKAKHNGKNSIYFNTKDEE